MTKFIANNWVAIVIVLGVVIAGLVVTLVIMDRKDKKLIAEYKATTKKAKKAAKSEEVVEEVEAEQKEAVDEAAVEETEAEPVAKKSTTKKSSK